MRHLLLLAGLLASSAFAQAPSTPPDDKTIVVQGRNTATVRSYVDKVAKAAPGHQLSRWEGALCVGTGGLAPDFARFIKARIAETAKTLRVDVLPDGCKPTVYVLLTDQADALTKRLIGRRPTVQESSPHSFVQSVHEQQALAAPHIVRWLTATITFGRDGTPIFLGTNMLYSGSLIHAPTQEEVTSKLILIDKNRLAGVTLDQLADYLAFVTFAAPDIGADYSKSDSIMALFAGGSDPAPARLTKQDRLFLDALYSGPAARSADQQQSEIRAHVAAGKFTPKASPEK